MIKKAVIPAAGLGTRFLPYTKAYPKEMLPLIDTPILFYLLEELIASGIEEVIIIINHDKDSIKDYFKQNEALERHLTLKKELARLESIKPLPIKITYVYQEEQKGLGHAIYQVKPYISEEAFVVLLGDDLYDAKEVAVSKQLIDIYQRYHKTIIGVKAVADEDKKKYGICLTDHVETVSKLTGMIEKPDVPVQSNLAAVGRYVLTYDIFRHLETVKPDKRGEIQLTDALETMIIEEGAYGYQIEDQRFDTGTPIGFLEATLHYALKRDDLKDFMISWTHKHLK